MADWQEDDPVHEPTGTTARAGTTASADTTGPADSTARTHAQRLRSRARSAALGWLRAGRPEVHRMLHNRRQVLMTLGTGAVALGGLGSTAAVLLSDGAANAGGGHRRGDGSPRDAGAFSDRDASYVHGMGDLNDLGASGVADTPSQAAAMALRATPKQATPLSRDPVLHLLRRATFGTTAADVAAVRKMGLDAWIEQQLNPASIADPVAEQMLAVFPTVAMSIAELRPREDDNQDPMYELGRATIGRQIWSSRQLYEVVVDFWSNHLNVTNPFDGGQDSRGAAPGDAALPGQRRLRPAQRQRELRPRAAGAAQRRDRRRVHRKGRAQQRVHHDGAHDRPQRSLRLPAPPALDRSGQGARLRPHQQERKRRARARRRVRTLSGRASVYGQQHRAQAGGPVRLRQPAQAARGAADQDVPRQRHRDPADVADTVPLAGVLGRRWPQDAPPAGEPGRHEPGPGGGTRGEDRRRPE